MTTLRDDFDNDNDDTFDDLIVQKEREEKEK